VATCLLVDLNAAVPIAVDNLRSQTQGAGAIGEGFMLARSECARKLLAAAPAGYKVQQLLRDKLVLDYLVHFGSDPVRLPRNFANFDFFPASRHEINSVSAVLCRNNGMVE